MMTTKLIISSLVGIGALGGATVGGYYWLSNKDSEKSQKLENETNSQTIGTTTNPVDTKKTKEPASSPEVPKAKPGPSTQSLSDAVATSRPSSTTVSGERALGAEREEASGVGPALPGVGA